MSTACGFGWASEPTGWFNALCNLDADCFDGIMIQWYEGGCDNGYSGSCPVTKDGALNFIQALAGKKYPGAGTGAESPPALGACFNMDPKGTASKAWNLSCSDCHTIPAEKMVIGQTATPDYPAIPPEQLLTLKKEEAFAGIGFWTLATMLSNAKYTNLMPTLSKEWKVYPWYTS